MSYNSQMDPELDIRQDPFTTALAAIFLPGALQHYLGMSSSEPEGHTKIQFSFFSATSLFEDSSFNQEVLNTYVVGASLENTLVQNLPEPVNIILQHIKRNVSEYLRHQTKLNQPLVPRDIFRSTIAFPDDFPLVEPLLPISSSFQSNGFGGWNTSGCEMQRTDKDYTLCNCNHLTHFGVLLDLPRTPISGSDEQILTLISCVGCGVSSIFLGLALVVYLSIQKLREDYPARILINLCFALLMLNLTFLVNSWLASFQKRGLCITTAVVLHYFLLVTFSWMGLEAIHMYGALVKVFNTYITNYILKFAIVGWGVPVVVVSVVLIINPDIYGPQIISESTSPRTLFCWIQDGVAFYLSVVAYFCLVFLMNISMFVTVLLQIRAVKTRNRERPATWSQDFLHDLKRVASLTFLLGLTWGFAFFAWGPVKAVFMYLFAICNTLQGFFIFLFHCLLKENVRKQCQTHFCLNYPNSSGAAMGPGHQPVGMKEDDNSMLGEASWRWGASRMENAGLRRRRPKAPPSSTTGLLNNGMEAHG
ncbi:adhesion G-protein coupled receptor G4 [Varanus komodoensis]|uniref:adhesion G-protein coupled receptor G4 n=1 Tax=Varanus komodoensis TaxID=61221 RepID=UPI001CF7C0E0|nr:adhesion G-protein coupled receptor G4 [Varanus komodoensis]